MRPWIRTVGFHRRSSQSAPGLANWSRRIDFGVTKHITVTEKALNNPLRLELTAELLNVFDMINTVAYSWIPDARGVWQRVPTRLTPRTFNVRLRVTF